MSIETRDGGAEYIAAGIECSLLHLLSPELLLGMSAEVTEIAQEECTARYDGVCDLAESVQLTPNQVILSFICHRQATCRRLCEQAAEHARETAHYCVYPRLSEVAVQN